MEVVEANHAGRRTANRVWLGIVAGVALLVQGMFLVTIVQTGPCNPNSSALFCEPDQLPTWETIGFVLLGAGWLLAFASGAWGFRRRVF